MTFLPKVIWKPCCVVRICFDKSLKLKDFYTQWQHNTDIGALDYQQNLQARAPRVKNSCKQKLHELFSHSFQGINIKTIILIWIQHYHLILETSKTWFYKLPAAKVTKFRGNIAMLVMITSKQVASFDNLSGFFLRIWIFLNTRIFWKLEFFEK